MSILIFLVILLVLILVHEFGHFITAKKFGIRVDEFGVGFPPKIYGVQKGETEYTVNALPFGGFVKIFGEDPSQEAMSGPDAQRSFVNKPKYVQALVLVAGVVFNLLLAWMLFSINFMVGVPTSADTPEEVAALSNVELRVLEVLPDSPAQGAGITPGTTIVSLSAGGEVLNDPTPETMRSFVDKHSSGPLSVSYEKSGTALSAELIPYESPEDGAPIVGVGLDMVGVERHAPHIAVWEGLKTTVSLTQATALGLGAFLAQIFTGNADFSQVSGPVGIVNIVGDAAQFGLINLLGFTALISINLAIINILPFPALDGGRLLFVIIEKIKGSPIRPAVANGFNFVGFALLILLMLVVTWHDIAKLIAG